MYQSEQAVYVSSTLYSANHKLWHWRGGSRLLAWSHGDGRTASLNFIIIDLIGKGLVLEAPEGMYNKKGIMIMEIAGFVLIVIGGILIMLLSEEKAVMLVFIFMVYIGTLLITIGVTDDNPQAIDVYRGKTTLRITYQDNVPVDSVVVFKDKKK